MNQITPAKNTGTCDKCRRRGIPVRTFEVTVDGRTSLAKRMCDDCWPRILSAIITMIH